MTTVVRRWDDGVVLGAARVVVGMFALAACGRVHFDEHETDAGVSPWGVPVTRSELRGDRSNEDPSVSSDRLTIVWTSQRSGGLGSFDIWMATRTAPMAAFENVRNLVEINSAQHEGSPELSADGLTLSFASEVNGASEIYRSVRPTLSSTWGAPLRVDDLSSAMQDYEVAIAPDELTAMINREGDFVELTRANVTASFGGETVHPELYVADGDASPTIDNGARTIYFHSGTIRDLYVARRTPGGTFSAPVPVVELDTPNNREADPFMSADDRYLVFNCEVDICEVERE